MSEAAKPFLDLAQGLAAAAPFQPHLERVGVLDRADVHADALRRAGIAQLPEPVGALLQPLPLVVGAQRVAAGGAEIEAGVELRAASERRKAPALVTSA